LKGCTTVLLPLLLLLLLQTLLLLLLLLLSLLCFRPAITAWLWPLRAAEGCFSCSS
jgi:hypothetical protein